MKNKKKTLEKRVQKYIYIYIHEVYMDESVLDDLEVSEQKEDQRKLPIICFIHF